MSAWLELGEHLLDQFADIAADLGARHGIERRQVDAVDQGLVKLDHQVGIVPVMIAVGRFAQHPDGVAGQLGRGGDDLLQCDPAGGPDHGTTLASSSATSCWTTPLISRTSRELLLMLPSTRPWSIAALTVG